jgi:hypothetical protein
MWSDKADDPCEIRYEYAKSTFVPNRIEVLHGDTPFAVLNVDDSQ